jgi:hypothetical protein
MSETIENLSRKRVLICLLLGLAFSVAKRYIVMLFYDPHEDRNFGPGNLQKNVFPPKNIENSEDVVAVPHAARQ